MTFDDDDLRALFQSSGPSDAELAGNRVGLQARLRQRVLRRRATVGAVAAALFGLGGFLLIGTESADGDDVQIDGRVVTQPTTSTTEPDPTTSTSSSSTSTSSTTDPTTTTSSTASTVPPGLSMREVDLQSATYADACAAFGDYDTRLDDDSVTLSGGSASLAIEPNVSYEVRLEAVGYGDADGDGDEDAVVFLHCDFVGASETGSGLIRGYRATPDGGIEQIGDTKTFGPPTYDPFSTSASGLAVTVHLDVYADGDPACCPSGGLEEVWTFDGSGFDRTSSTPTDPPRAG